MSKTPVKRTVPRWFIDGKGFASEFLAYRYIATRQLQARVCVRAEQLFKFDDPEGFKDYESMPLVYVTEAYKEIFPVHDEWKDGHGRRPSAWCNLCRTRFLNDEARRLRSEAVSS